MTNKLSHIDEAGNPKMVNVSNKAITKRTAIARAEVLLGKEILDILKNNDFSSKKGPILQTAIIAGTMAVKKTSDLIPMCHPLAIQGCDFDIQPMDEESLVIECCVTITGKTGVEMEALTGASIAALTIYDMCKALSKSIQINNLRLVKKTGGKSDFNAAT